MKALSTGQEKAVLSSEEKGRVRKQCQKLGLSKESKGEAVFRKKSQRQPPSSTEKKKLLIRPAVASN